MRKYIFRDIAKNARLFFGTFIAMMITAAIICACLNLVFSATAGFDYGHRFDGVDLVVMHDQDITITITEEDGDIKEESEAATGRIPLGAEQLQRLQSEYGAIADYPFHVEMEGRGNIVANATSAMALSGFSLEGQLPKDGEILLDEKLAQGFSIGDTVSMKTNFEEESFVLSGIVTSDIEGMYDIANYAFVSDSSAIEYAVGCYGVGIVTDDAETLAQRLENEGYEVYLGENKSRAEINDIANNDISLMVIFITMGALCLVISIFVISGTVRFSIVNRFKDLALLRVIGLTKGQVTAILVWQTFFLGVIATSLGAFIGMHAANFIADMYRNLGIISDTFTVTHSYLWDGAVALAVILTSMFVSWVSSRKPLSAPPASAIKSEADYTSKISAFGVVAGIVLLLGGTAILIFTPLEGGLGIGMVFCAVAVYLAALMCITPLIIRLFNLILSLVVKRFVRSLGQVAYANINFKATKFAVASVSIAIMISMGTMMLLNNITYMDALAKSNYDFADEYLYVANNFYAYEVHERDVMGTKNIGIVANLDNEPTELSALAVYGALPNVQMLEGSSDVSGNTLLVSEHIKELSTGDSVQVWLPDGLSMDMKVSGIFKNDRSEEEGYNAIISHSTVKNTLYDASLDRVYTNAPLVASHENTLEHYTQSPEYDVQLGASLLLGGIGIALSVVALFNTFAIIMSVRKREFNGLKNIGAKKKQIFNMTVIETFIVVLTGAIIGVGLLVVAVGSYSYANTGVFDFIVNETLFYGVVGMAVAAGMIAGIVPSLAAIGGLRRNFRNE